MPDHLTTPLPAHIAEILDDGWIVIHVSDEPTLLGCLHSVTFEQNIGVTPRTRTSRHVRRWTADTLRGMIEPSAGGWG